MKEAILIWLILRSFTVVKSNYLETDFKEFFSSRYGRYASASNISRRWRELKGEDGPLQVTEVGQSPEGEWVLVRYGTDSWNQWQDKQRSLVHG